MKRQNAYFIYLMYSTVERLMRSMYWTAAVYFYVTVVGLNPFQLVIVGTTLMVVILLAEVPTGIVADTWSRRLSVIIGVALMGMGFALDGAVGRFAATLAAQFVWGIGATFTSGALEAWIADEWHGENMDHVFLRGTQFSNVGSLIGIGAAIVLANVALNLPMIVAGAIGVALAAFLAMFMPERHFRPHVESGLTRVRMAGKTLASGARLVRGSHTLLVIMAVTFFFGMASESFDRLWEVHFLNQVKLPALAGFTPVAWFGMIDAGGLLLSIGAAEFVRRQFDTRRHRTLVQVLMLITALLITGMAGFGLARSFGVGLAAYWGAYLMRQLYGPLYTSWLNRHAESGVRATVLSMAGQVDAVGQIAGGPLFGMIATSFTTGAAIVAAGLMLLPTMLLYRLTLRRERANEAEGAVVMVEG